jgi:hypothetical protein
VGYRPRIAPIFLQTENGIWHWCPDCSGYPCVGEIAASRTERPASGRLCGECQDLEEGGRCDV